MKRFLNEIKPAKPQIPTKKVKPNPKLLQTTLFNSKPPKQSKTRKFTPKTSIRQITTHIRDSHLTIKEPGLHIEYIPSFYESKESKELFARLEKDVKYGTHFWRKPKVANARGRLPPPTPKTRQQNRKGPFAKPKNLCHIIRIKKVE